MYWPTSIKDTINWFPFIDIMEHTANIMKTNKGIIPSLLNTFVVFVLHFIGYKEHLEVLAIRCINFKKETGLYLQTETYE